MSGKICSVCKKAPATIKLSKLVKGQVREMWLCARCAARRSPYFKPISPEELLKSHGKVEALISSLVNKISEEEGGGRTDEDRQCPTCGLPLRSYRDTLFLGCSDCYEAFEDVLVRDLRRYHGATTHRGRTPATDAASVEPRLTLEELRRQLEVAVAREDFELAARLRDEIRRVKMQLQDTDSPSSTQS